MTIMEFNPYTLVAMTIVSMLATSIVDLIRWAAKKITDLIPIIREKYETIRYGPKMSFSDTTTCQHNIIWPAMSSRLISFVEEYTGKNVKKYVYNSNDGQVTKDVVSIETPELGISVTYVDNDVGDGKNTAKLTKYSIYFYSRVHTHDEFNALLTKIADETYMRVKQNVFITRSKRMDRIDFRSFTRVLLPREMIHANVTKTIIDTMTAHDRGNFMLYGPPGTGKTTIINQIADHFDACIFIANLAEFESIHDLRDYFLATTMNARDTDKNYIECRPKMKVFLFEDFNTSLPISFWEGREASIEATEEDGTPKKTTDVSPRYASFTKYSYSDLINLLDGVIPLTGAYTFWTTNHIDDINPSLYRPGRMEKYYINHLAEAAKILGISQDVYNKSYPDGLTVSQMKDIIARR